MYFHNNVVFKFISKVYYILHIDKQTLHKVCFVLHFNKKYIIFSSFCNYFSIFKFKNLYDAS